MKVLVTGGAGYIGSHTALALLKSGADVVVLDNLSNGTGDTAAAVQKLARRPVPLIQADVRDRGRLDAVLDGAGFDAVVHLAAVKSLPESIQRPLHYYGNNVTGTLTLLDSMAAHGVRTIVFSSSAAVYGDPGPNPAPEDAPTRPASPYGRSKLMGETLLHDLSAADPRWRIAILRYFNAVGADASGTLGENSATPPGNLLPSVAQVASGEREILTVFGTDYATPDGTSVRDYLHVSDLADGHVRALDFLARHPGASVFNLGTGHGHSVLDVIRTFEPACGRAIPWRPGPRRTGDVPVAVADAARANADLGWQPKRDLAICCRDCWLTVRDGRLEGRTFA